MPDYNTFFQLRVNEICIASMCHHSVQNTEECATSTLFKPTVHTAITDKFHSYQVSRSLCEVHIIKYVFQTGIHFSKS